MCIDLRLRDLSFRSPSSDRDSLANNLKLKKTQSSNSHHTLGQGKVKSQHRQRLVARHERPFPDVAAVADWVEEGIAAAARD